MWSLLLDYERNSAEQNKSHREQLLPVVNGLNTEQSVRHLVMPTVYTAVSSLIFSDLLSTVLLTMRVTKGQSLRGGEGVKPRPLPYSKATGM